ncbi:GNAT family N-acetyltransferase [Segetibacter sp.]|jgi:putative acetyltransferase|uniref:GNAT family N-acetyltransferase n=1 Tax=Segetibacter sp. TaxID=2231182 RepID=UPI00260F5300|nr:GNAT family N-acetyltransferase [Segetibacter sp.]MCW3078961.1 GCN5-related N-acetyltransferase [Segetibacter sp.]
MENEILIRKIELKDNAGIATIIRSSLAEFGANKPGTVFFDNTTDHLFEMFQEPGSIYYVAEQDGKVLGGAGVYPSKDLPPQTCELVKMYLHPAARGKGLGKLLITRSLEFAKGYGYLQVYIETMPELKKAVSIYEKFGFDYLNGPLGNTGHFGCDVWMLKKL